MADTDMNLAINITGDAGSAVSAVQQTNDALSKTPESVNVSQASLDRLSSTLGGVAVQHGMVAESAEKAGSGIAKVGAAAGEASRVGSEFNSVGGDMARMMSSLGVESGAAAGRIGAFAGALESLKTAAPEVISAVALMTASIAGFEVVKEAIGSAAELQDSMTRLGAVVRAQGGNWNLLSAQVKEFADTQSRTTTYTETEVITSMNRLVAAGMSVKDSMTTTRVAEDLAAATGHNLTDVTVQLIEAQHGRLMGLESLGLLTKEQIKDGMTFNQVLQAVEDHMGGAAQAATTTFSGALTALHSAWDRLMEDAGTPFLGILTSIVNDVERVVNSLDGQLQPAFKAITDWAQSQIPQAKAWFEQLWQTVQLVAQEFHSAGQEASGAQGAIHELGDAIASAEASIDHGRTGWEFLRDVIRQIADAARTAADILGQVASRLNEAVQAQNNFARTMDSFYHSPLGRVAAALNPAIGLGSLIDATGQSYNGPQGDPGEMSGVAPVYHASGGIKTPTSSYTPPPYTVSGGDIPLGGTSGRGGSGRSGGSTRTPDGKGSATIPVIDVSSLVTDYDKAMDQITNSDMTATQLLDSQWSTFVEEQGSKMQEDLKTFKMSNSQKADYYRDIWMSMSVTDNTQLEQRKEAYAKYIQAVEADDKQRFQAEQQFQNQATQHISSFLNAIIVDHKSMASQLKSIYGEILSAFDQMIAKMLADALMKLPWIQQLLGLGGGGGIDTGFITPGSGVFAPPPGMGGNVQSAMPPIMGGNTQSVPPAFGGGSNVMQTFAPAYSGGGGGGSYAPNLGGGGNPFGGGTVGFGGGSTSSSGGASGGGYVGNGVGMNFGPGGMMGGATGALSGFLARSGLGGLGIAAFGGMALGDIAFGGKGYSALGGMLGALGMAGGGALALGGAFGPALLAMLSQPAGWALLAGAALLGAFGGSLFGDHFSQADEPDIYQNEAWGQANADMQGSTSAKPMNANGKQFVMDSQTAQATGGQGWNILMEKFVKMYRGQTNTLPYSLQDAFPQLEALWGGATDKADFNPDGKDGYLDIGSGKRALWTDFWGDINKYGSQISQLMQSMSPTEMFVTSVNGQMKSIGSGSQTPGGNDGPFILQSPGGGGNKGGSDAIASGGPGKIGGTLAQRIANNTISLNVYASGTLASQANLERGIQDAVAKALPFALEDINGR